MRIHASGRGRKLALSRRASSMPVGPCHRNTAPAGEFRLIRQMRIVWGDGASRGAGRPLAGIHGQGPHRFLPTISFPPSRREAETRFFGLSAERPMTKKISFPDPLGHPSMRKKHLLKVITVINIIEIAPTRQPTHSSPG